VGFFTEAGYASENQAHYQNKSCQPKTGRLRLYVRELTYNSILLNEFRRVASGLNRAKLKSCKDQTSYGVESLNGCQKLRAMLHSAPFEISDPDLTAVTILVVSGRLSIAGAAGSCDPLS